MKYLKYLIAVIIIIPVIGVLNYKYAVKSPFNTRGENLIFVVQKGDGVRQIASNLQSAKLINSALFFNIYAKNNNLATKFQAGEYELSAKSSMGEIADILVKGKVIRKEKEVKFIEGWTTREMDAYLVKANIIQSGDLLDYSKNEIGNLKTNYDFLNDLPVNATLEGFLFPDTYKIHENAKLDTVVKKMLSNFNGKLTEDMRADIKKQGKTIYEIVTMASLIEKEVKSYDDKRMVSGIFWNRIKNGQALESCATLAYILGVNKKQYTYEDTKIDSPYNSYMNRGLPPGPISNPSINAIKAAIYPIANDYVYFLSRFDNGETVFSKTYDEHLLNKAKYLK
ncbi:endolytic transglycosylase MltG [Candidatus Parcubacteria bacterium]|nr:endolytic transglycosylase MltG [Patescibacteria group bacterium]MBU4309201.1 endolytic transglycosylase MltG [Patescibacteria group bacterium]MBU4432635.1 endolytic transglycosylase MltG [Patescibacteria group bacterium]MBU4577562.1 endolytic transglycosylase MltG [Patescibacteria group bacterium]MCG2697249.1 endolytic transglycosylase MltG [Candidatus Parcubacteria bacterium]